MSVLEQIQTAYGQLHKLDKGQVADRICARIGFTRMTLADRMRGKFPFRRSEIEIVFEELGLTEKVSSQSKEEV